MNLSGEAILKAKKWYKLDNKDILVVYDDVDLKLGTFRYRENGSAGTHNGMRNILGALKTEELRRLRIGIENRENRNIPLMDFVLGKFTDSELEVLYNISFKEATEKIVYYL